MPVGKWERRLQICSAVRVLRDKAAGSSSDCRTFQNRGVECNESRCASRPAKKA